MEVKDEGESSSGGRCRRPRLQKKCGPDGGGGAQCCHKKKGNHFTEPCVRGTAVRNDRIPPEERLYFCWHAPRNICDASEVSAESHENKLRMDELLHFPGSQR